jgi:hypothetical protein
MSTVTWTGNGGNNWGDVESWSSGSLPGTTDDVVLPYASGLFITSNVGTVQSVVSSAFDWYIDGGALTVTGNLTNNSAYILLGWESTDTSGIPSF